MPPKKLAFEPNEEPEGSKTAEGKTVPPTLEDLKGEYREVYDKTLQKLSGDLLGYFTWTRHGGIKVVGRPENLLDGVDLSTPSEERNMALRQEMNYMIGHAMARQSEVLVNLLEG